MKTHEFLSRLEKVRKTGDDSWIACCPSHSDRSPSLTVSEKEERLLIHCFAGCSTAEIVGAVGMELSDLFPERIPITGNKQIKKRFMPQDVIQCLSGETLFLILMAESMLRKEPIPESDYERLKVAHRRFANAAKAAGI